MQSAEAVNDPSQAAGHYIQDRADARQQKHRSDGKLDYVNNTGYWQRFRH